MGITGCNVDGNMDVTRFSKPMPWIGIYIATASLACLITMATDLIHGIRARKLWFPCKYFCLNATSLTIIGVAAKLSVDLNTPVPQRHDQLAKLSSSALICTIMANSMPSLGITDKKETMMNVVAMGILVITMIVNICIQFGTGVVYEFWAEHAVIMSLMLILLMTMFFSALSIPKMKHYLELKYKINEAAIKESSHQTEEGSNDQGTNNNGVINNLRIELMKIWMMAHTSSPQFVVARSVTCTASGALCLLSTGALAEAMLRSYLMPWSFRFCAGESDYKWSTILILIVQVAAVAVGTIAPAFRWFIAVNYRCPNIRHNAKKKSLQVEGYWTQRLLQMRERPIGFRIHNRHCRKFAHDVKSVFFNYLIKLQIGIVFMSKVIQCVSVCLMKSLLWFCDYCKVLKFKFNPSVSSICYADSKPAPRQHLRRFVLHLEGEEELVGVMMKDNCDATSHWFQVGEKKEPKLVIELLEKFSVLEGLKGVAAFDSDRVLPLHSEEPPNCWSLPLVTIASIIVALPNIDRCSVKKLIATLDEGIHFVKFIENNLDKEGKLSRARMAAETVWLRVDLYEKWLDLDLYKLSLQSKTPKETLERLVEAARIRYDKFRVKYSHICSKVSPSLWPAKLLASNSMYRICKTILLNQDSIRDYNSERLFQALKGMVSDILCACLTNLPYVISTKCLNSPIEEREDSVRYVVCTLGKTKRIIEMLEKKEFLGLDFSRGTNIEDWCLMHKQKSCFPIVQIPLENDDDTRKTPPSKSSDLCLDID